MSSRCAPALHYKVSGIGRFRLPRHMPVLSYPRRLQRALWRNLKPTSANPVKTNQVAAGSGVSVPLREKAMLKVGGVVPPTMSVPTRSQSGSSAASRVQACRSDTPTGNGVVPPPLIGLDAESQ